MLLKKASYNDDTPMINFVKQERKKGKKIYLYGASTKGNTLLQYYNLLYLDTGKIYRMIAFMKINQKQRFMVGVQQ